MDDDTQQFFAINALTTRVSELESQHKVAMFQHIEMKEKVDKHQEVLYGGEDTVGLKAEVKATEERVKDINKVMSDEVIPEIRKFQKIMFTMSIILILVECGSKFIGKH